MAAMTLPDRPLRVHLLTRSQCDPHCDDVDLIGYAAPAAPYERHRPNVGVLGVWVTLVCSQPRLRSALFLGSSSSAALARPDDSTMPSHHRPAPLAQTFVARSAAPVALP